MNNATKVLITLLVIFQIILFVIAGIMLQNSVNKSNEELALLYAKKDELYVQEQSLIQISAGLNESLKKEQDRYEALKEKLANLTGQQDTSNAGVSTTMPSTTTTQPAPRPIVTRAS